MSITTTCHTVGKENPLNYPISTGNSFLVIIRAVLAKHDHKTLQGSSRRVPPSVVWISTQCVLIASEELEKKPPKATHRQNVREETERKNHGNCVCMKAFSKDRTTILVNFAIDKA